ncbi:protein unc-50 homolog [Galendromus occidentalis]|uniref:Protein unc-50 homolog n=1 Tax=Galendromus occidentalis TaxID=34638 RepID=A0AAJ7SHA5_9ACAR|nr:protein unc-50 homolog [Galendromus occidentalis]
MDRRGLINGLPKPIPGGDRRSARDKGTRYIRRLFHFQHMDFQFATWQMASLFYSPQKVYRNFQYRKQTKDQFARDDPAFLVLLLMWMIVSCVAFVVLLGIHFLGFFKFLLWTIFIDCVGVGLVVATIVWIICNKYLIKPSCRLTEDVEWGYCFDVHLNAFFPALIILHLFQLFFYHIVIRYDTFVSRFFGDTLFLIACAYYVYITFLGYSALPILRNTKVFLYPMAALLVLYLMSLTAGFNLCRTLVDFYHYRVM